MVEYIVTIAKTYAITAKDTDAATAKAFEDLRNTMADLSNAPMVALQREFYSVAKESK